MGKKETVEAMIQGGQASAAPPLGPALGPMKVNIGNVIAEINKKTAAFKGMQVPIKVIIDSDTKEFNITVGTPPASALIKKEAGVEKGSGNPLMDKVADVRIEQIIKVAKMKEDSLLGKTLHDRVKEIIGACNSIGILVEGVPAKDAIKLVNEGKFDEEIKLEKTELTAEELKQLEAEKIRLAEESKARHEAIVKLANDILKSMEGKDKPLIKAKMREAKIPESIIAELLPSEKAAAPGEAAAAAPGAKPAAATAAKK